MNSEAIKFSRRLHQALDFAGIPQKGMGRQSALVKMLAISHRVAKKWLDGEEFPPTSKMVKISSMLNVRSNWLFSGQGEMQNNDEDTNNHLGVAEVHRHAGELSQEAFEVAAEWVKLPYSQRQALRKVIKELSRASSASGAIAS